MTALDQPDALGGVTRLPQGLTIADTPAAARYDPCNPLPACAVSAGSNKKYWWRCTAGSDHRWEAVAKSVTASRKSGCPFCAGKRPSVTNRLDILYPVLAGEWDFEKNQGRRSGRGIREKGLVALPPEPQLAGDHPQPDCSRCRLSAVCWGSDGEKDVAAKTGRVPGRRASSGCEAMAPGEERAADSRRGGPTVKHRGLVALRSGP